MNKTKNSYKIFYFLTFSILLLSFTPRKYFAQEKEKKISECIQEMDIKCLKKKVKTKTQANSLDSETNETLLYIASGIDNLDIVKFLILKGASPNKISPGSNEYPIHKACEIGNFEIIKFLLNKNSNPRLLAEGTKETIVHKAAIGGNVHVLDYLSKKGAEIDNKDKKGRTPIFLSCENGNYEFTEKLVLMGTNFNLQDLHMESPLHLAARSRHPEIVRLLLEHDANYQAISHSHETPLLAARVPVPKPFKGETDSEKEKRTYLTMKYLLEKGANPDEYMPDGDSALIGVTRLGYLSCVKLLREFNADLNHKKKDGRHALYVAVEHSYPEIVAYLVDEGADVNLEGPEKETAAHLALRKGEDWISRILLFGGADINKKDKTGVSPKDLSKEKKELLPILNPIK